MIAGLLHDLGEMYIAPEFGEAEADRELDASRLPPAGWCTRTSACCWWRSSPTTPARWRAPWPNTTSGSTAPGYPHRLTGDASRCSAASSPSPMRRWPARGPDAALQRASVWRACGAGRIRSGLGRPHRRRGRRAREHPGDGAGRHPRSAVRRSARPAAGGRGQRRAARRRRAFAGAACALDLASFLLARLRVGWNERPVAPAGRQARDAAEGRGGRRRALTACAASSAPC